MNVPINVKCECRRGKKDNFKRREKYLVNYLFQMGDGEIMVNVQNQDNWTVNCYASRFVLPDLVMPRKFNPA